MSDIFLWGSVAIFSLILALLAIFLAKRAGKGKVETDYRSFFTIGVIWLTFGIVMDLALGEPFASNSLTYLGLIFTIAGLVNKDKWGKVKPISPSKKAKAFMLGLVIATIIAVSLAFLAGSKPQACESYMADNCPPTCTVCPPCETCSSISCHTKEYCASIGFNDSWYEAITQTLEKSCEATMDCACGTHIGNGECFYGNAKFVNVSKQCPDFCTGIAGNLEIKCLNSTCTQVMRTI